LSANIEGLRTEAPCGCVRAVVQREVPDFDEAGHIEIDQTTGLLKLATNADGTPRMKVVDDIQDRYCPEHAVKVREAQLQVQRVLESGADPSAVMRALEGALPFPALALEAPDVEA